MERATHVLPSCCAHIDDRSSCTASTVRAEHSRFYDSRETRFILNELESVDCEDSEAILQSCEDFVDEWAHVRGSAPMRRK